MDISHGKMRFHVVSYLTGRTNCKPVGVTGQLSHCLLRLLSLQSGRYLSMFLQNLFCLRLSLQMDVLSFRGTSVNFCLTIGQQIVITAHCCVVSFVRHSSVFRLKYSDEIIVVSCMGVALRLRHQDQDIGWGCVRIGRWASYMRLTRSKGKLERSAYRGVS